MRQTAPALAAFAAAAVLLSGCGGGSGDGAESDPPAAGSDAATSTPHDKRAPSRTSGSPADDDSTHSGADGESVGGGADAGDSGGTAAGGQSESPSEPSGGGSDDAGGPVPLADPGHYTYRAHGHADTALGDRDFDGKSHLTVTAPADDTRHETLKGEDGTTEQTVVGRRTGLYLADLKMSQQGFNAEFRPDSPVLLFPAGAQVGDHWSWQMTSTEGDYTLHATLRFADDDGTATVNGRQVQTVTVKGTLVLDGDDFTMTLHQLDEAAAGGLVVHEHTTGDGKAYGTPVHTEADRRLI